MRKPKYQPYRTITKSVDVEVDIDADDIKQLIGNMATDADTAAIINDLAATVPPLDERDGCLYCRAPNPVNDADFHYPDCLWRRAVEWEDSGDES